MSNPRLIFLAIFLLFSPPLWPMGHVDPSIAVVAGDPENSLIGKPAPDVVLSRSDGTSASVIAQQRGKSVILVFWATWCPHCYEELGNINDHIASFEKKGIKIILVDVGETRDTVKAYFDQRRMKRVSFVDENSFLQESYHLIGIPTVVFIDEKGIIRNVTHQFPSK